MDTGILAKNAGGGTIMIIGVDYYPEHWDRSRWTADADLMRQTGVRLVRLAELSLKTACLTFRGSMMPLPFLRNAEST